MRLTTVILIASLIQVSAATFGQRITMNKSNTSIFSVLKEIRKQSGYDFYYDTNTISQDQKVSVAVSNATIEETLLNTLANLDLVYRIQGKIVTIKKKEEPSFLDRLAKRWADIDVRGKVTDEKGLALPGATVKVKGTAKLVVTGSNGEFVLTDVEEDAIIVVSYLGYESKELKARKDMGDIAMVLVSGKLDEVNVVVNTGFQSLPKERATGSFSQINNDLINRTVSTGIMSRIADVVPGLIFNKGYGGTNGLVIRGQTSIDQNTSKPLIIVDNFPYEGDINNINPNDVENITILKDAAASSIWGARAGNGVIVITTKQGKYDQKPSLSFTSNYTVGAKPDAFYQPLMSTSDFIDNEIRLFGADVYRPGELNQGILNYPLTPLVELLIKKRDNPTLAGGIDATIAQWRNYDVRNDFEKYLYRNLKNQQYALNLSGGSDRQRYVLSLGYDKNLNSEVGNGLERVTINANNTYNFFQNRLELLTGVYYTHNTTNNDFIGIPTYTNLTGSPATAMYPYAQFADASGNPLALVNNVRVGYAEAGTAKGLLDWNYRPLEEIDNTDKTIKGIDYRFNGGLKYKIINGLKANLLYQYSRTNSNKNDLYKSDSYYARNLINYYSQVTTPNTIKRPIPLGGILDKQDMTINVHNFRAQLNYDHTFGTDHELNALAGYEVRDQHTTSFRTRLYGYDDQHATSQLVNYSDKFPAYVFSGYTLQIPNMDLTTDLTDRFLSLFANGSYFYKKKYLLSGSVRFDRSNIFGVKTNNKGVPLYSFGGAWNIYREEFLKTDLFNDLKLRATFGTSGNVNRNISALTTINYSSVGDPLTNKQYATVRNAPNPDLRWEKIQTLNVGVDIGILKHRINGSVDWYHKRGTDIISTIPYAPQTGFTEFTGNYSNSEARGWDINLQTKNFDGLFKWSTDIQISHVADKVTKTKLTAVISPISLLGGADGDQIIPFEGKPLFAVYAYKWAGLNPQNGNPQGYLSGEISEDYNGMYNEVRNDFNKLNYIGTARPTFFGAVRNTVQYKSLSISANVSYRFDYYFRRRSVNYSWVNMGTISHGDYGKRWTKPGDELKSNVPSVPVIGGDTAREGFYALSEVLVEKADHVRLQDILLSYDLDKQSIRTLPFQNLRVFCYINNAGILWKATKSQEDPDYYRAAYSPVKTISLGLNANF